MLLVIFGILEVRQSDYSRRRGSGTSSLSYMTGIGEQKKHSMAGLPKQSIEKVKEGEDLGDFPPNKEKEELSMDWRAFGVQTDKGA